PRIYPLSLHDALPIYTVIISRGPFDDTHVAQAEAIARKRGLEVVYLPGHPGTTAFHRYLETSNPRDFYASYAFDVSPVGDNRPLDRKSTRLNSSHVKI